MDERRILQRDNIVITALNNGVFPGAAVGFSQWTGKAYECSMKHYGFSQCIPERINLKEGAVFDLASLTKPLATTLVLLSLFEKKSLQPGTTLGELFSLCPEDKCKITIRNLLSHSSGLPAYKEYFNEILRQPETKRKEEVLEKIMQEKLCTEPGKKECYSDLGFILLGYIIEKVSGRSLSDEVEKKIYTPLELQKALFFDGLKKNKGITYACTEKCLWGQEMLCGEVHDDNCRAMGGVAGHAGLFGTLEGVMQLCQHLLDQYKGRSRHPAYSNTLLQEAWTREPGSEWALGFDTPAEQGSSSGIYFSKKSVGHLGFTGTSFWIDPEKECIAVLLTNRVHPSRKNEKIKEFRPILHDTLMKGIERRG